MNDPSHRGDAGRARVRSASLVLGLALGSQLIAQTDPPRPVFVQGSTPLATSTDGTLVLRWSIDPAASSAEFEPGVRFELEEARDGEAAKLFDVGRHLETSLSGRDDGRYRYRVRAVGVDGARGRFSEPAERVVAHHPLELALALFGVGALVFVATAGVVIVGHRRTRAADPTDPRGHA